MSVRSDQTQPTGYVTLSEGIDLAMRELEEALKSEHLTDYAESRIRRALTLLGGKRVP